jgi:hypothetical protein
MQQPRRLIKVDDTGLVVQAFYEDAVQNNRDGTIHESDEMCPKNGCDWVCIDEVIDANHRAMPYLKKHLKARGKEAKAVDDAKDMKALNKLVTKDEIFKTRIEKR